MRIADAVVANGSPNIVSLDSTTSWRAKMATVGTGRVTDVQGGRGTANDQRRVAGVVGRGRGSRPGVGVVVVVVELALLSP
jgi:hypothetical protein